MNEQDSINIAPRYVSNETAAPQKPLSVWHHVNEAKWVISIIVLATILIMIVAFILYIKFYGVEPVKSHPSQPTPHIPTTPPQQTESQDVPSKAELEKLYELSKTNTPAPTTNHEAAEMLDKNDE